MDYFGLVLIPYPDEQNWNNHGENQHTVSAVEIAPHAARDAVVLSSWLTTYLVEMVFVQGCDGWIYQVLVG
jgi:hypothetical protein